MVDDKQTSNYLVACLYLGCFMFLGAVTLSGQTPGLDKLAFDKLEQASTDSAKTEILVMIATRASLEDYVRAAEYALLAVHHANQDGDNRLRYLALSTAGEVYLNAGLNDIAVDFFLQYYELAKQEKNERMLANAYLNLSAVWLSMDEGGKAENSLLKVEEMYLRMNAARQDAVDAKTMASLYNNLVILYAFKKDKVKGRAYFEAGIRLVDSLADAKVLSGMLHLNYGDLLFQEGDRQASLQAYDKAMAKFRQVGDKTRQGVAYVSLGNTLLSLGDTTGAMLQFKLAYQLGMQTNNRVVVESSAEALHEQYKLVGQVDSSFKYLSKLNELRAETETISAREKLVRQEMIQQFENQQLMWQKSYGRTRYYWLAGLLSTIIILVALIFLWRKSQRHLQQTRLEKLNTDLHIEQLSLEKELLATELQVRDKQLATEVMHRIQNTSLVKDMVQRLMVVHSKTSKETKDEISKVVRGLEQTIEDRAWEDFELRFQQLHVNFYERLQAYCPALTTNERRLCAFIKLNMNTKEIAALTGQSINSITVARTRLRKKLGLSNTDVALISFISGL
jgi:tetratricopeptide (TPR) repeat protein/DNA-binding CsgD family transcriptional regulator